MYRGYNLTIREHELNNILLHSIGLKNLQKHDTILEAQIKEILAVNGKIDGNKLESLWFPQIIADVFISHSHNDEKSAITLAGFLKYYFNLDSFIDSKIWGYSNELLKRLDSEYCYNKNINIFDYDRRNLSTSHVHLMLSMALAKMMNNCECLFFLNTPNSIKTSDAINNAKTTSPWIYYEIGISSLISKPLILHKNRQKPIVENRTYTGLNAPNNNLEIQYKLPNSHLTKITVKDLHYWKNTYVRSINKPINALDLLYNMTS